MFDNANYQPFDNSDIIYYQGFLGEENFKSFAQDFERPEPNLLSNYECMNFQQELPEEHISYPHEIKLEEAALYQECAFQESYQIPKECHEQPIFCYNDEDYQHNYYNTPGNIVKAKYKMFIGQINTRFSLFVTMYFTQVRSIFILLLAKGKKHVAKNENASLLCGLTRNVYKILLFILY